MLFNFYHICPVCDDGFYWDEEDGPFGDCTKTCDDIDDNCLACNFRGTECLSCQNGFMPEADGLSCIEYFDHCSIPVKDQDDGKLPKLND